MHSTTSPQSLRPLFAPKTIAIVGASPDPNRSSARVWRALRATRFGGRIYLVSRSQEKIGEQPCYKSIAEIPEPVDLAAICVSAANVPQVVRQCGDAGVRSAIVFADGFHDNGLRRSLSEALAHAQARSGLRLLGPNTVGVRNTASWTYVTFSWRAEGRLRPGPVATITQSGGLGSVFGKAMLRRRGLGPRYVIDTGNEFDVDAAEAIEYVAADRHVACISVIVEGCRDGNRLASAVQRVRSLGKPVVFLKTGRSQAALAEVASHTGALAGVSEVFDSVMRDAGACVVQDEGELVDAVVLHSFGRVPKGRGLGVITPSGGYGILTLDAAERFGMPLPAPSVPFADAEEKHFRGARQVNPFDMSAGVGSHVERWAVALRWMASQPGVDALLMWQASILEHREEQDKLYPILRDAVREIEQPIFCCGLTTAGFERKLRQIGVLLFAEPTRLVKALSLVAPRVPSSPAVARSTPAHDKRVITGERARAAIAHLRSLKHAPTVVVTSADAALQAQQALKADKVVLKAESEHIGHKTEFGMVSGAVSAHEVAAAFAALESSRAAHDARHADIVLQPFIEGTEIALGAYVDPVFGPMIMVSLGGIYLEVLRDTAFARAPVSEAKAMEMISALKGASILMGARGRQPADLPAIARAVAELSQFFWDNQERYREIDVNPLIAHKSGTGATAVDVMLVERCPQQFGSDEEERCHY